MGDEDAIKNECIQLAGVCIVGDGNFITIAAFLLKNAETYKDLRLKKKNVKLLTMGCCTAKTLNEQ